MVIRTMNSIFDRHGRYILALLTLVIIVAFVGLFTPGFMSLFRGTDEGPNAAFGTVFGEKVSNSEWEECWRHRAIALMLSPQVPQSLTYKQLLRNSKVQEGTFEQLAMIKAAQKCGVRVTRDEIAKQIRETPRFMADGKFSMDKYDKFVNEQLKKSGLNAGDLDEAVRLTLLVQKLNKFLTEDMQITKGELKAYDASINEKIDAREIRFRATDFAKKVNLKEEAVRAFFENRQNAYVQAQEQLRQAKAALQMGGTTEEARKRSNEARKLQEKATRELKAATADAYLLPAEYQVDVVRFNYIDYEKAARESQQPAHLKKYYDENKVLYRLPAKYKPLAQVRDQIKEELTKAAKDKKAVVDEKAINEFYQQRKYKYQLPVEYKAFDSVKAEIGQKLVKERMRELAGKDAYDFAAKAYEQILPSSKEPRQDFAKLAGETGRKVYKTDWFKDGDNTVKGVGREPALIAEVTKIYAPTTAISNAVNGERAAFVAFLVDKKEPKPAEFEQVKKDVEAELKDLEALKLAREKAREIALKLSEAKDLDKVIQANKSDLKITKLDTFIKGMPMNRAVGELATKLPSGGVSGAKDTPDGAIVVIVDKRTMPDDKSFEQNSKRSEMMYKYVKNQNILMAFNQWVKANSRSRRQASE